METDDFLLIVQKANTLGSVLQSEKNWAVTRSQYSIMLKYYEVKYNFIISSLRI